MRRIIYFDILNVISCLAVVGLHANGFVHTFIKDEWWWLRVFIEVVLYFAVPVFFMLTGATLIEYRSRYTTKEFYKKRFMKTFVPFAFWGFVFMLCYVCGHEIGCRDAVMRVTTGRIPYTNYWFFIPLFMIYVFMPFLSLMVTNMSKKLIVALCVLLFFFQSFVPTLYSIIGLEFPVSLPISGYFMFVLIGYYLAHSGIEKNKRLMALVGGGSFSSVDSPLCADIYVCN